MGRILDGPSQKGIRTMSTDFTQYHEHTEPHDGIGAADDTVTHLRTGEAMDTFTVRLPVSTLNILRGLARERKETTGAVIRRIIGNAVADHVSDDATVSVSDLRALIARAEEPHSPTTPDVRRAG